MGHKLPKAAIYRIEVATRKQMRERQKDSAFMRKSLNIFNGQSTRCADSNIQLPYTIEEFRAWLKPFVGTLCSCGRRLTLKALAVDHQVPVSRGGLWSLGNLAAMCRQCNWRKGKLLPSEYASLVELLIGFSAESREDVFRRLTLGGKWSFKS